MPLHSTEGHPMSTTITIAEYRRDPERYKGELTITSDDLDQLLEELSRIELEAALADAKAGRRMIKRDLIP
jgi:hypothetical protein